MTTKSLYLSEKIYRELPTGTRKNLCKILGKKNIVGRYVHNVLNDLNTRGEFELAREFEESLTELNYSTAYIY